ncbi:MAG: hypothetical protein ACK4S0_00125 [Sediminibacterium sp.]
MEADKGKNEKSSYGLCKKAIVKITVMKSKQEKDQIEFLQQAFIEGEQSNMAENFDSQALLNKLAGSWAGEETGDELNVMIRNSRQDNAHEVNLSESELEDIRLYDEAKKEDNGERILFSDYLRKRKKSVANQR